MIYMFLVFLLSGWLLYQLLKPPITGGSEESVVQEGDQKPILHLQPKNLPIQTNVKSNDLALLYKHFHQIPLKSKANTND